MTRVEIIYSDTFYRLCLLNLVFVVWFSRKFLVCRVKSITRNGRKSAISSIEATMVKSYVIWATSMFDWII